MRRICALLVCLLVPLSPGCDRPVPVAPEGSTLTITANPSKIQIDGTSQVTVLARKLDGTPVNSGTEITLSTNLGTIEPLVETNSSGVALATLTGDGRVGTANVQAFSGAAGEATIDVTIGGLASFMGLSAQPQLIPRDGGQTTVTAEVFDIDGAPLIGAFVTFTSDVGSFSTDDSIQTNEQGRASDVLTVTREDMSNLVDDFFLVTARSGGEGGAPVEESIEIDIGGNPSRIVFSATPTTILITGGTIELLVTVFDGNSDTLDDIAVNFLRDLGTLNSGGSVVRTNAAGEARDTLTVTESDLTAFGGTTFSVSVQVGGVGGLLLEDSATIQVQTDVPRASFIATGVPGSPMEFSFDSTSTGQAPLTCAWQYGDGGGDTQDCSQIVEHTYSSNGTFTVTLTVSNSLGEDTATGSVTVPHGL